MECYLRRSFISSEKGNIHIFEYFINFYKLIKGEEKERKRKSQNRKDTGKDSFKKFDLETKQMCRAPAQEHDMMCLLSAHCLQCPSN